MSAQAAKERVSHRRRDRLRHDISPLTTRLMDNKYVVMSLSRMAERLRPDFLALQGSFSNLPEDPYYKPEHKRDGVAPRARKYGRFKLDLSGSPTIERLPHAPHTPNPALKQNQYFEGKPRNFEPLDNEVANNRFFQTAMHAFGLILPEEIAAKPLEVKVQQFRISAPVDKPADITPEGFHQDGERYVAVLVVDRKNVNGGEVLIFDNQFTGLINNLTPDVLDAYMISDQDVIHGVTSIIRQDKEQPGYRDVFIMNFNPMDELVEATPN